VEEGEWEGLIPMSDEDIGQPGLGQAETVGHPHFQVGQTLLAKRCDCRELGARLERGKTRLRLVQKKRGACILILGAKKTQALIALFIAVVAVELFSMAYNNSWQAKLGNFHLCTYAVGGYERKVTKVPATQKICGKAGPVFYHREMGAQNGTVRKRQLVIY
jgi:hypothetical protein